MVRFQQVNDFLANSNFFYTIAIGMDSRYSFVSSNYNRNFDQSNGSLLSKHFSITLHPEDVSICAEVGRKCFEQAGQLFPATLRKHDGMGGYVVTQWEMKAFFSENGDPAGIFCIGYNITEYIDTRSRLADATSVIAEKDDQLNEIGFMQSHVIRKPLANIMGLASILEHMEMDSNQRNINEMMISSAKELDMVIRQITIKTGGTDS
jgi:signal transduction histidine kinase